MLPVLGNPLLRDAGHFGKLYFFKDCLCTEPQSAFLDHSVIVASKVGYVEVCTRPSLEVREENNENFYVCLLSFC